MTKEIIIIALLIALIYLYYQQEHKPTWTIPGLEENKLKLKQQELNKRELELERLKKEKSQVAEEWKAEFSKQEKLLEAEALENSKLLKKIEELEAEIKKLKSNMPGSFPE